MPAAGVALELHLDATSPEERTIWDRYRELVEAAGPSELVVTKPTAFWGGALEGK